MQISKAACLGCLAIAASAAGQSSFVNWETPHVNPLDLTPDGTRLLAVNTPDNRLEVYDVGAAGLVHAGSVPVGLDPVSVRARTNDEAWVVNHVSDSVSVIDLTTMTVAATLSTAGLATDVGDEPADVVFAGDPQRAFVSISQLNQVRVYDPADLTAPPVVLDIEGEDPRALATDGASVYVAIFQAGNDSTILGQEVVSSNVNPYQGNENPPPNDGTEFDPPIAGDLPDPPEVSLIVRKDAGGIWRDDNGFDWSSAVTWDLHGHDLAVIDAGTLSVSYVNGVMNANMNLAVGPAGDVVVIGTEATNEIRFEPNVRGTFVRVMGALVPPAAATPAALADLNPHLDYTSATVAQNLRDQSLGDPRGVVWSAAGDRVYVTGMGSSNVAAFDASLARLDEADVGQGPTGIRLDETNGVLYVLNKFDGTISTVDVDSFTETQTIAFYDPTPPAIKIGRPHLYDTHETSGLGQASCASCHVDGRMDQIAWDLGDPQGEMKPFNQICNGGIPPLDELCEDWHPMKGPMTTQTLIGMMDAPPFHWRADREDLAAFNGAFESLLADDEQLTVAEMQQLEDFIATLTPAPNPYRNLDGSLGTALFNGGNADEGEHLFNSGQLDAVNCSDCHALPTGTNGQLTSANLIQETQSMKIPQLRNMHEKTGFEDGNFDNNRGFGYIHDGSVHTVFDFLEFDGFQFANDQEQRDVEAFMFSFATDTHAGVGAQATIGGGGLDATSFRDELIAIAETGDVGMVAKGVVKGEARGYFYLGGGQFQSDRADETATTGDLDLAAAASPMTFTLVPDGSEVRIGVDRDEDGFFDRDELDLCASPIDPDDVPGDGSCPADIAGGNPGDGAVDILDLLVVLGQWGQSGGAADVNCSGGPVDVSDLLDLLAGWGPCP